MGVLKVYNMKDSKTELTGQSGLTEEQKKLIIAGHPALTADGCKATLFSNCMCESEKETVIEIWRDGAKEYHFDCLSYLDDTDNPSHKFKIIGLWDDTKTLTPEVTPFNLTLALQGEPVKLRNGSKAYIQQLLQSSESPGSPSYSYLVGFVVDYNACDTNFTGRVTRWDLGGSHLPHNRSLDIQGMFFDNPEVSKYHAKPAKCSDGSCLKTVNIPKPINSWGDRGVVFTLEVTPEGAYAVVAMLLDSFTDHKLQGEARILDPKLKRMLANGLLYDSFGDVVTIIKQLTGRDYW